MTARAGAALYTPELLALAVSLAERPYSPSMSHTGEARSRTCGSSVRLSCTTDSAGKIADLGLQVSACAVGQAAAALFAQSAQGSGVDRLAGAREAVAAWLAGSGSEPWPGFAVLDPARAFPARHGAILLAWDAALAALSKEQAAS